MNLFNDISSQKALYRAYTVSQKIPDLENFTEFNLIRASMTDPVFKKIGAFNFGYDFNFVLTTGNDFTKLINSNLLFEFIINVGGTNIRVGDETGLIISSIIPPSLESNYFVYTFSTAKPQKEFVVLT